MKAYASDLHIHSCLSPCGDMEMTPNNLVNMAYLKGLEVIAVCDHNTALNLPAIQNVCLARDILLIPGIETESKEEVHMLCYFPTIDAALAMTGFLHDALPIPKKPYDTAFFGEQIIMNDDDEKIGEEAILLSQATTLSIESIAKACRELMGVPVPAHINKDANSIISNLGFIPPNLSFKTVEVAKKAKPPMGVNLNQYRVLHSSDAHCLESIYERESYIHLEEKTVECFLNYIK